MHSLSIESGICHNKQLKRNGPAEQILQKPHHCLSFLVPLEKHAFAPFKACDIVVVFSAQSMEFMSVVVTVRLDRIISFQLRIFIILDRREQLEFFLKLFFYCFKMFCAAGCFRII